MYITIFQRRLGLTVFLIAVFIVGGQAPAGTFPAESKTDLRLVQAKLEAAMFLSYASFGPTSQAIDELAARIAAIGNNAAFEEWIDNQFALPPTLHQPLAKAMISEDGYDFLESGFNYNRYKHFAWWHAALSAPDQLRQRMAWALAQIFVVSDNGAGFGSRRNDESGNPQYLGIVDYYDMLLNHAFGNYRECLEDVTFHPIMGVYLSHVRNQKAAPESGRYPDENYAREVMQLFSIGLFELKKNGVIKTDRHNNPIETYTNEDIQSFARVFTGLRFADGTGGATGRFWSGTNFHHPMVMDDSRHDTAAKTLLKGTILPSHDEDAGRDGMKDIRDALDNLFNHPNVGPFIARRLIQRLVKSNPSKRYVQSVAKVFANNGKGVRGDFKAVIKAILLHKEALRNLKFKRLKRPLWLLVTSKGTEHSRLQEPVIRYAAMIRAFHGVSQYYTGRFMIREMDPWLNQEPYRAHHVFNFYEPDYQPPGDVLTYTSKRLPDKHLYAPEFKIATPVAVNSTANRFRDDLVDLKADFSNPNKVNTNDADIYFDISSEEAALSESADALMTHLDLLLCYGSMSDAAKEIVAAAIESQPDASSSDKVKAAILAVLMSPACAVAN